MKRFTATLLSSALAGLLVTAGATAQETLKIGWIGPLSGWGTFGGTAIMRGTSLAIDHINAEGGVHGRKLELVPRDSAAKPEQAITVARELIDRENVYALIGKFDSSSAKALNPVIHEGGVPMMLSIAAATKNIEYERDPNFMFRTSGADHFIAEFLVDFAMKEYGAEKIAIGYEDTGYGFGGRDDITRALEAKGMEPVAKVKFSRSRHRHDRAGADHQALGGRRGDPLLHREGRRDDDPQPEQGRSRHHGHLRLGRELAGASEVRGAAGRRHHGHADLQLPRREPRRPWHHHARRLHGQA